MNKHELFKLLSISDSSEIPGAVMGILFGPIDERDSVYGELLRMNGYDLSFDWFQELYEGEMAERKEKKQDFTPASLGVLCSRLTGASGTLHEPTAGNGSMIIQDWNERRRKVLPWEFFPSQHMVTCWELSNRSVPLLLLNLSIRGMMGYVYHGDVLEGTVLQKYILLNRNNDSLGFSDVVRAGMGDNIAGDEAV